MKNKALVAVHAYRKTDGGKNEVEVWEDRIEQALETSMALRSLGVPVTIAFLGGYTRDGETMATIIQRFAQKSFEEISEFETICIDSLGRNTRKEIQSVQEFVRNNQTYTFVVSISNRDHAPRINRIWSNIQEQSDTYTVAVTGSCELPCPIQRLTPLLRGRGFLLLRRPLHPLHGRREPSLHRRIFGVNHSYTR